MKPPFLATNKCVKQAVLTPNEVRSRFPLNETMHQRVFESREQIKAILTGEDQRLLIVVGPCSIHDVRSAMDYARRLADLAQSIRNECLVVMRVYVEKPRTELGWQGYLMDPNLDGSGEPSDGLLLTRQLMCSILDLGLPIAMECLTPIGATYLDDCLSWAAVGARSVESQLHRNFVSGLPMPVGCKNTCTGAVGPALSMMVASGAPQRYLSIDDEGRVACLQTGGNPDCHLILRGGHDSPNYGPDHLRSAQKALAEKNLNLGVVVDCSHGNSGKQHEQQVVVAESVLRSFLKGDLGVRGMMLESHIESSKQKHGNHSSLRYGQSITDACLGWEETAQLLHGVADTIKEHRWMKS